MYRDYAMGVVPIYKRGDELLFCLIQDSQGFWGFPKGHVDRGESKEATAKRELQEEAGIEEVKLDTAHPFTERYVVQKKGKKIDKTVTYYVGYVERMDNETPEAFKKEIPQMKWLSYADAKEMIRPQSRSLLEEVSKALH
jgi:bis(5'-nucleosidyl)-tetraphosphatase